MKTKKRLFAVTAAVLSMLPLSPKALSDIVASDLTQVDMSALDGIGYIKENTWASLDPTPERLHYRCTSCDNGALFQVALETFPERRGVKASRQEIAKTKSDCEAGLWTAPFECETIRYVEIGSARGMVATLKDPSGRFHNHFLVQDGYKKIQITFSATDKAIAVKQGNEIFDALTPRLFGPAD